MMPLLLHSPAVPPAVRAALEAAERSPPGQRHAELQTAARLLYSEAALDCREVHDLIGLSPPLCGCA